MSILYTEMYILSVCLLSHSTPPSSLGNCKFVHKFICTFFWIPHIRNIIHLFFSSWLSLVSLWQSVGPSMSLQIALFHSFLWLRNIPLSICTCLLYPFPCRWTFSCFHGLAIVNSVQWTWCACILLNYGFLWLYAQEWDCWVI